MASPLPYSDKYSAAIKISGLISVLSHAAILCALAWLFPFISAPTTDETVTIDLAYLETGAEYTDLNARQAPPAGQATSVPPDASSFAEKKNMQPGAVQTARKEPARPKPRHGAALAQKPKESEPNLTKPPRKSALKPLRHSGDKAAARAAGSAPFEIAASSREAGANGLQTVSAPSAEPFNPKPAYPELARKRGQEGTARIRCEVDTAGNVAAASIAGSSGHKLLDEAALETVRKWRFRPALSQGRPARGTVIVPVEFRLR